MTAAPVERRPDVLPASAHPPCAVRAPTLRRASLRSGAKVTDHRRRHVGWGHGVPSACPARPGGKRRPVEWLARLLWRPPGAIGLPRALMPEGERREKETKSTH